MTGDHKAVSKSHVSGKAKAQKAQAGWPVVVYLAIGGFGFTGYFVARIVLDGKPHPLHWISGIAGAIVGYIIGWIWYLWRGDIL